MKKIIFFLLVIVLPACILPAQAQFSNFTTANSNLPSDYVCGGVTVDQNNHIWVGTDAGVAMYDGSAWTTYTTSDGLPSDIITCLAVDKNNNIWIGTDGDGVAKFNGTTWTVYNYADGLVDNGIHAIACAPDSSLWFGSWGAGVSRLKGSTWTTFNDGNGFITDGFSMASVYDITCDAASNIWLGTDLGLVKYNSTSFTAFDQSGLPDLRSNYITAVAVDAANNKWLGVLAKGMAKLNASNAWVANYDTTQGLANNGVSDICVTNDAFLWTGEYTQYGSLIIGGITRFDPNTGTGISLNESDGLVDDQVFRIALDQNSDLWIATGGGLSKYHDNLGVESASNSLAIRIYPNPAQSVMRVDVDCTEGQVMIYDVAGRILRTEPMVSPMILAVDDLNPGVYFLQLVSTDVNYTAKFIKK